MFFVLSKTVGFLAVPSNVMVLIGLAGALLLLTRFARAGRWMLVASVVVTSACGFLPIGKVLAFYLEERFPRWDAAQIPDGIVILGGALNPDLTLARGQIALGNEAERLTEVATIARRYPSARIVFSGGTGSIKPGALPEARYVSALLESFGVPGSRIAVEDRSRNTEENARFTKELVRPKPGERWALITSATHMPRAVGCFRRAGFDVEAYPVDFQTYGPGRLLTFNGRLSEGLGQTDVAMREWIGLLVYWLTGRTSELFPGPR
jgi:uncharacterized SAM-binding protein YcdF (DUF218 family)